MMVMALRKYKVVVYSQGYGSILLEEYAWANSKKQASRLIRERLIKEKEMEKLHYLGMQDLPFHIVDVTDQDEAERAAKRETKRRADPKTRQRYETCPKCGGAAEYDYCPACGWQRFAKTGPGKALGPVLGNNGWYHKSGG